MDSARRRFLAIAAAGTTGLLSGCINGEDDEDTDDDRDDTTTDDDVDDGVDDERDDTATDDDIEDVDEETVTLGGVYSIETIDEFAFEVEMKEDGTTATGRHYRGDTYVQSDTEMGPAEFYSVGDDRYAVLLDEGMCVMDPRDDMTPSDEKTEVDAREYESDVQEYANLSPEGTTRIDGEQVYIFELTPETTDRQETVTFYVGVDSGHLRRVETPTRIADLTSWGDVEPVEAPDMDCQDLSDLPMPPGGL